VWDEIVEHLAGFESAVLTGVDAEGYPYSVRCRPRADPVGRVLRVRLPAEIPIRSGPASLLCHSHDANVWNLRSFLVRGELGSDARGWKLHPLKFVPGAGIGGSMGVVRFVVGSRRNARRYLDRRGLSRPRVPWAELVAIKAQAKAGGRSSGRG
jgi:hypothetical protein